MTRPIKILLLPILAIMLVACDDETPVEIITPPDATDSSSDTSSIPAADRQIYFGDTHVHSDLSLDAYLMGNRGTPDDAYRFARGEMILHASGREMQLSRPLDFLAVTDHAYFLGSMRAMAKGGEFQDHELAATVRGTTTAEGVDNAFAAIMAYLSEPSRVMAMHDETIARSGWDETIEAAKRHYQPGEFTTFVAYEYTSGPEARNLHRNVLFRSENVPPAPFSALNSPNPEDLWKWMDDLRDGGIDSLAIPHNSNGSDGWMFALRTWAGPAPDVAWAEQRIRNEPIVENTQLKGTSDTHPLLSPNDEWADFEIMPLRITLVDQPPSNPEGSYVREALANGMLLEQTLGVNPFQFGVIGSSDSHNAAGTFDESDYWSKMGVSDIEPQQRGSVPLSDSPADSPKYSNHWSKYWGASGLAGVWAGDNTREEIFDAMRRKETFSTSGPRIRLRFFAGYEFNDSMFETPAGLAQAYSKGVPMGGELEIKENPSPDFFIWALRDIESQPLQRVQIIKAWVDDGTTHERVFDVACSDGLAVDPVTHRCPDNGAKVNLNDCTVRPNVGDDELKVVWRDPSFDAQQPALYYVRALENPSCRWSTWDAIRAGVPPRAELPATIQERAWTSPIWLAR